MKNLRLRTKLLAIAVPPLAILAVLVAYALELAFLDSGEVNGAAIQADLRVLGMVGLAGVLGSALALVLVTRSVTGPLTRLTRAADELSGTRLPALVEQLRNPAATPPEPAELLELDSDDELGRLARALDGVQAVATEVTAAQKGLVRESLSTLVVNLARRNQAMLERQLSFIDQLETSEHDPDRLEDLYRLDHLATRMRRNAESLLVLAGAEPARRRGAPVQVVDVARVAIGEIEDYRHVELGAIDDVEVGANVAVDLAHLLSELMENATQFSPPDAPVVVEAGWTATGTYAVAVIDQGIGMADEQLADANELLSSPPELGLDLSRSLGFLVIGRLARRLGVAVSLRPSPERGVTATVALPADLIVGSDAPAPAAPAALDPGRPWPAAAEPPGLSEPPTAERSFDEAPAWPTNQLAAAPAEGFGAPVPEAVVEDSPWIPAPSGPKREPAVGSADPHPFDPAGAPWEPAEPAVAPWEGVAHDPWATESVEPATAMDLRLPDPSAAVPAAGEELPASDPQDGSADEPSSWWAHPSQQGEAEPAAPGLLDELRRVSGPRRLADALPEGEAFDRGISSLLAPGTHPATPPPVEPPVQQAPAAQETATPIPTPAAPAPGSTAPERTQAGLVRRRRGEQAPAEQSGRPVTASSRSPEEIREMLARYRSGIKHRRPVVGTPHDEEATR